MWNSKCLEIVDRPSQSHLGQSLKALRVRLPNPPSVAQEDWRQVLVMWCRVVAGLD